MAEGALLVCHSLVRLSLPPPTRSAQIRPPPRLLCFYFRLSLSSSPGLRGPLLGLKPSLFLRIKKEVSLQGPCKGWVTCSSLGPAPSLSHSAQSHLQSPLPPPSRPDPCSPEGSWRDMPLTSAEGGVGVARAVSPTSTGQVASPLACIPVCCWKALDTQQTPQMWAIT